MDTPDGSTQFAPYVMMGGKSVTIYVIELNDKPCYFRGLNNRKDTLSGYRPNHPNKK